MSESTALLRPNDDYDEVPTTALKEHPRNPRKGSVAHISKSVTEHGFVGPIVVQRSTNYVLAGNHRLKAARDLGLTRLPVLYVDMTDDEALRFLLSDNRVVDFAGWDDEGLNELLGELRDTEYGLHGTGFDLSYLDAYMSSLPSPEDDDIADIDHPEEDDGPVFGEGDEDAEFFDVAEEDIEDSPTEVSKSAAAEEAKSTTRQLLCVFTAEEYEEVMKGLTAVCKANAFKTYASAVRYLVSRYKDG